MNILDVATLSDAQLEHVRLTVLDEQLLRRKLDASPEKIAAVLHEYQDAHGICRGEDWEFPTTALKVYGEGAEVAYDGKLWVSTHSGNAHPPGQSGWRLKPEVDEETGAAVSPPFVQPAGAHDAYRSGERITWEDGKVYEAARDAVVHSPAEHAPDWVLVEAEGEPVEPGSGPGEPETPTYPEFAQPTGGHDAYQTGDLVTFEGAAYRSTIDGNVWSPTGYPQGWEKQ